MSRTDWKELAQDRGAQLDRIRSVLGVRTWDQIPAALKVILAQGHGMREVFAECYEIAASKGWHDDDRLNVEGDPKQRHLQLMTWLMLAVTELAEAAEDVRMDKPLLYYEGPKPCGFGSEIADVVIRLADTAGALGLDLAAIIEEKSRYNRGREKMHGGKTL